MYIYTKGSKEGRLRRVEKKKKKKKEEKGLDNFVNIRRSIIV